MKRQIICMKCIKKHPSLFLGNGGVDQKGVDEYINNVKGIALYDFMCDYCGKPINKGDICDANSIWTSLAGIPYHEWEEEYINTDPVLLKMRGISMSGPVGWWPGGKRVKVRDVI